MLTDAEREMLALLIGQQVRDGRKRLGLSQIELAQGIGSQSMISLIESGRQLPLSDVLDLLAAKLDDEVLRQYGQMMSAGTIEFGDISKMNHSVLLNALRTQRGRWQDVYGRVATQLCEYYYNIRIFGTCREICQLIHDRCESMKSQAIASFYHGSTYLFEDQIELAQKWLRQAENLQDRLEQPMQGKLMYNLAYLYTSIDVQGMAMWYAKEALEKFSLLHDFSRQAKALGLLGAIQYRIGLVEDAKSSLSLAMEIAQKWSIDTSDYARIASTLAETYWEMGDLASAESMSQLAVQYALKCNDVLSLVGGYRTQYRIFTGMGDVDRAKESLENAISILNTNGPLPHSAHTYLMYMDTFTTMEARMQMAVRAYEYALTTHSAVEEAFAAECLATLYEDQEQLDKAAHYRKLALSAYREHIHKNTAYRDIARIIPPR